jgi:hypothetical protein
VEDEKEKAIEKDQETMESEGELAEKDLSKVAGGINSPRDAQSGLPC